MNLILLDQMDFVTGDRVRLDGRRHRHITGVLQAAVGQELHVGLIGGRLGSGRVSRIGPTDLELEVSLDRAPPPPMPVTLLLALPRPKVLKRIIEAVTAIGVKRIVLFNTWRVDKSYWQTPLLAPESLREHCLLGLEQGRDTALPEILLRRRFRPFVEDDVPKLIQGSRAFVAHPGGARLCPAAGDGPVVLAIGPEGGFIPYEVDEFTARGFETVHLGSRALKVETAVPVMLGRFLSM